MMAILVIFLSLFLLVFAFSMSELVKAIHKQNDITERHLEYAKEMFIEVKGNRLNNEKTRILNEQYLEIILLEKKLQFNPKEEVIKRPRKQIKPKNNA
jgi:hypothetical protein